VGRVAQPFESRFSRKDMNRYLFSAAVVITVQLILLFGTFLFRDTAKVADLSFFVAVYVPAGALVLIALGNVHNFGWPSMAAAFLMNSFFWSMVLSWAIAVRARPRPPEPGQQG